VPSHFKRSLPTDTGEDRFLEEQAYRRVEPCLLLLPFRIDIIPKLITYSIHGDSRRFTCVKLFLAQTMFVEINCFPLQVDLLQQCFIQGVSSAAVLPVSAGYLCISFYLHFVIAFMKT
jgi:hypothetical protein